MLLACNVEDLLALGIAEGRVLSVYFHVDFARDQLLAGRNGDSISS